MDSDQKGMTAFFREIVLVLGGVFAVRGVDDETVGRAATGLERAWLRAHDKARQNTDGRTVPHPAIAALLRLIAEEKEKTSAPGNDELFRLPGLFRRWEFARVIEPGMDYHIEDAGDASDGTPLFAIYRREPNQSQDQSP
jgi:hypothetical protein